MLVSVLNPTPSVTEFLSDIALSGDMLNANRVLVLAAARLITGVDDDGGDVMLFKAYTILKNLPHTCPDNKGRAGVLVKAGMINLMHADAFDGMKMFDAIADRLNTFDVAASNPGPLTVDFAPPVAPVPVVPAKKLDAKKVAAAKSFHAKMRATISGFMKEVHPEIYAKYKAIKEPVTGTTETTRRDAFVYLFTEFGKLYEVAAS